MAEIGHFDYARNDFKVKPFDKKALVASWSRWRRKSWAGSSWPGEHARRGEVSDGGQ